MANASAEGARLAAKMWGTRRRLVAAAFGVCALGAASAGASPTEAPTIAKLPTLTGKAQVGSTLTAHHGAWSGRPTAFTYRWLRCDRAGKSCKVIPNQTRVALDLSATLAGSRIRTAVTARAAGGTGTALSAPSAIVLALPTTTALTPGMYFKYQPSTASLPRPDALCASLVTPRSFEPRPENNTANHTVPSGPVHWNNGSDQTYWKKWIANRNKVTGNYTGTTDEIIRWASCKWGLDENTVRAVADQESEWHESEVGDQNGSFGIMQVKDHTADGHPDLGGYPDTARSTALNVDMYGAWERSCLQGAFYDGGDWLYGGKKVVDDVWGCVGAWFSGDWHDSGAEDYVAMVQKLLARKDWLHLQPGP